MISSFVQLLREIQCSVQSIKLSSATETPANLDRQLEVIENKLCYVIIIMTRYQNGCTLPDSVKKGPPFNWDFDDAASTPSNSPMGMTIEDDEDDNSIEADDDDEAWRSDLLTKETMPNIEEIKPNLDHSESHAEGGGEEIAQSAGEPPSSQECARVDQPTLSPSMTATESQSVKVEWEETPASPIATTAREICEKGESASSTSGSRKRKKRKKKRDIRLGGAGVAAADEPERTTAVTGAKEDGVPHPGIDVPSVKIVSNASSNKNVDGHAKSESETEMAEPLKRFLNINFDELFKGSGCEDGSEMSGNEDGEEEGWERGKKIQDEEADKMPMEMGRIDEEVIDQTSQYVTGLPPRPKLSPPIELVGRNYSTQILTPSFQTSLPSLASPQLQRQTAAPETAPVEMADMVIENEDSQSDTTLFSMNFPCDGSSATASLPVVADTSPSSLTPADVISAETAIRDPLPPLAPSPPQRQDQQQPFPLQPPTSRHGDQHSLLPPSLSSPVEFHPERSLSPSNDLGIAIPPFLLQSSLTGDDSASNDGEKKLIIAQDEDLATDISASSAADDVDKDSSRPSLADLGAENDVVASRAEGKRKTKPSRKRRARNDGREEDNDDGSPSGDERDEEEEDEEEEHFGRWHVVREESTGLLPVPPAPSFDASTAFETSSIATVSFGKKKKKKSKKESSKTKIYPCPQCTLTFSSKSSLKIHQKFDVHEEEAINDVVGGDTEIDAGPAKPSPETAPSPSRIHPDAGERVGGVSTDVLLAGIAGEEEEREDEVDASEDRESTIVDVEENDDVVGTTLDFGDATNFDCCNDDDVNGDEEDEEDNAKSDLTLMERLKMEEAKNDALSQEFHDNSTAKDDPYLNSTQESSYDVSAGEAAARLLRIAKPKKKTHKCEDCGKTFSTTGNLNVHYRAIHGGQKLMCGICDRGFAYIYSLKLHMESIHGGRRFPCAECDKDFAYASALKTHEAAVHRGRKFPCKFCKKEFTHSGDVTAHIESLHYGRRFPCKFCVDQKKVFTHRVNLRKHMKDEHGIHPKATQNMKFQKTYEPTINGKDFPEEMRTLDRKRTAAAEEQEEEEAAMAAEEKAASTGNVIDKDDHSSVPPPPLPPSSTHHHKTFDEALLHSSSSKKHLNQRYLCVVCRDEFKAVSALRSHMEMRHPDFVSRPVNGAKPCVSIIQSSKNKP